LDYPVNGIQNGSPDGVALLDNTGTLVEFLSYEGVFAAASGPATGIASVDIGVSEQGTEAPGLSLARSANGTWTGPSASTFGACNDGDPPPLPAVIRVSVSPSSVSVPAGRTVALTATAFDENDAPIPGA